MDRLTRDDLNKLAESTGKPAVSIYIPTMKAGREVRQNEIRFNNMLAKVFDQLTERGWSSDKARKFLAQATELARNSQYWQHQSDGLAIFITPERFLSYRLPIHFDEQIYIGSRFYVAPLVPLLQQDGQFYILAVSQNVVRLFSATQFQVNEMEPAGLPTDLRSALNIDEYVQSMQQHVAEPSRGRAGGTLFHGQGGASLDVQKKDEIRQFFHVLNGALAAYLRDDHTPLVFAGVEYLFPIFKETCKHKGLIDEPVTGNPDRLRADEIHAKAWAVVEPHFHKDCDTALALYNARAGTDTVTHDIDDIIRAAKIGQIDTLLVTEEARNPRTQGDLPSDEPELAANDAAAGDLVNYAVLQTLANGGRVFVLHKNKVLTGGPIHALLRYPLALTSR